MSLILSLSNLNCISFNIVSVGVASYIFDFATFIGTIKCCSKDLAEYDDDDDKVEEDFVFNVSPIFHFVFDVYHIFPPGTEENKT